MSLYMFTHPDGRRQFSVDPPWIRGDGANLPDDVAFEALRLPDDSEWFAPCSTPDPCPDEIPHSYGRVLPLRYQAATDPFAQPLRFSSGVRWEPTDYKPIDQTEYRRFAAERGPNSQ